MDEIADHHNQSHAAMNNISNVIGNATFDNDISGFVNNQPNVLRSPEGNVPSSRGAYRVVGMPDRSSTVMAVKMRHEAKRQSKANTNAFSAMRQGMEGLFKEEE